MSIPPVRLAAPAKLTLSLRITGRRRDGYHLIDAEMVSLDLFDVVEVDPEGDGIEVVSEREGSAVPLGADNLVARALQLVGRRGGVRLHKRIAAGAGLGGGSSDAAAILRWADMTDLERAASLGADVPYCVVGGRARVRGIGEVVEPLEHLEQTFTLLTPPMHCSTPQVYAAWDEMGAPRDDGPNDLLPAALTCYPELTRWRDELAEASGEQPRLAGSGGTWFVPGAHPGAGRVVARTVPASAGSVGSSGGQPER